MSELFEHLPKEKRDAVINAAFMCFGKNGYAKSSIRDIATAAGISKASIFQYFGTKRELYFYLYNIVVDGICGSSVRGSDDYFDSIETMSRFKISFLAQYPAMLDFLTYLVLDETDEIAKEAKAVSSEKVDAATKLLLGNVDFSRFRSDIGLEKMLNIIQWVNTGYMNESVKTKSTDILLSEMTEYWNILKRVFYKTDV